MADKFPFDEAFLPVPPEATEADPAATLRDLYYRVGHLERQLEQRDAQAAADAQELLMALVSVYDGVTRIVERWGVSENAQQAAIIREVVGLGRNILAALKQQQVETIETMNKPLDPATSDVVGHRERGGLPPDTVIREEQIGYRWRHGLLRRAQVVVSRAPDEAADEEQPTVIS
jgi:molecular chaperone GrpE (heat shock protein)